MEVKHWAKRQNHNNHICDDVGDLQSIVELYTIQALPRRSRVPGLLNRVAEKKAHDTGCETPGDHGYSNDQTGRSHEPNGKQAVIEEELRDFDKDDCGGVEYCTCVKHFQVHHNLRRTDIVEVASETVSNDC